MLQYVGEGKRGEGEPRPPGVNEKKTRWKFPSFIHVAQRRTPMAATVLLLLAASGLRAGGRLAGGAQQSGRRNLIMVATAPVGPPKTDAIRIRGSKLAVADALPLRIEGQWYDVSGWADEHPGGRWLLEYARGRDVTALFRAIHLRNEGVASAALSRLPQLHASELPLPSSSGLPPSALQAEGALQGEYVFSYGSPPASPPLPPIDSALRSELRAMLRREFPDVGAAKATAGHWVRTALALAGTLACWAGWLGGSLPATAALPLVHWVLIAHTVHEATHSASPPSGILFCPPPATASCTQAFLSEHMLLFPGVCGDHVSSSRAFPFLSPAPRCPGLLCQLPSPRPKEEKQSIIKTRTPHRNPRARMGRVCPYAVGVHLDGI